MAKYGVVLVIQVFIWRQILLSGSLSAKKEMPFYWDSVMGKMCCMRTVLLCILRKSMDTVKCQKSSQRSSVCVCACVRARAQDDLNLSNLHMLEPIISIDVATYYKCLFNNCLWYDWLIHEIIDRLLAHVREIQKVADSKMRTSKAQITQRTLCSLIWAFNVCIWDNVFFLPVVNTLQVIPIT